MPGSYRHTQVGWWSLAMLGVAGTVAAVPIALGGQTEVAAIVALVLALVAAAFGSLTVVVDAEAVTASFGVGLFRKRVWLSEVSGYRPVRSPWYYGYGIRLIPGGWLYNVSGPWAIEFDMRSGGRVRIGTDEPDELAAALATRLGPASAPDRSPAAARRRIARTVVPIAVITAGLVALFGAITAASRRDPTVVVNASELAVGSVVIARARITEVSLRDRLPHVERKLNGFSFHQVLRGRFRVESLGEGYLYVDLKHPPFVLVNADNGYLAVNFRDEARTRWLFGALSDGRHGR